MNEVSQKTLLVEVMPGGWRGYEPGQHVEVEEEMARFYVSRGFLKLVDKSAKHKAKRA